MRFARSIILFALLLLSQSCDRQHAVVEYAQDLISAGEFERALEMLNRVDSQKNSAELDAMRGVILSLEPATMVQGMFLMNRNVDRIDDSGLRGDLFLFYIDVSLPQKAGQLVSGERVGPERFFRRDIVRLRSAAKCFEHPQAELARKMLEELPAGEERSDDYYAPVRDRSRLLSLLCLAHGIRSVSQEPDLYWLFDDTQREKKLKASPAYSRAYLETLTGTFLNLFAFDNRAAHSSSDENGDEILRRSRCEMIVRLGPMPVRSEGHVPPAVTVSAMPAELRTELAHCRQEFPGSLLLRRVWPVSLEGLDPERGGPLLFDESPFFPVYVPRPEFEPAEEDLRPDPAYPAIQNVQ